MGFRHLASAALFVAPVTYFGVRHQRGDDGALVPGPTSAGHHQIEGRCDSCHAPFGGVSDDACRCCHGEPLRARGDSHDAAKFDDPAKAADLAVVDARSCLACHREHRPEARLRGSVTVAQTFCFGCHATVGTDRASHAGFDPGGCAAAGCHNYHDNRALTRDYLERHRGEPALLGDPRLPAALVATAPPPPETEGARPTADQGRGEIALARVDWARSAHARASVGCGRCHPSAREDAAQDSAGVSWRVADAICADCHQPERDGFFAGKHGMRVAVGLTAMAPALARAPKKMNADAAERTLGCTTCHGAHRFDRERAAVVACEGCHVDPHTRAFRDSPHFAAWQREQSGQAAAGTGVSCATCHLPRAVARDGDPVRVIHNQNRNLRPSDRMAREVCAHCHGLGFALASLADAALVAKNFAGSPAAVVTGMNLVERGH